MDLHDYRDIAKIYKEKIFKKQLVLQGIFNSIKIFWCKGDWKNCM